MHQEQAIYRILQMTAEKRIALVAHDGKKEELITWVKQNQVALAKHRLCGTGTTARLIAEQTGLPVQAYQSGPLGGDLQIGSRIAEGEIDLLIFFWDPLEAQPHDPDVKALLRIAVVYDIPVANNLASADFFLHSQLLTQPYQRRVEDFQARNELRRAEINNALDRCHE